MCFRNQWVVCFRIIIKIKINESIEYSYIGIADFFCFQEKVFRKICSRSVLIFRGLTCDFFFQVQCIPIVERKANSLIEQQNCKIHEKRDRLLVWKMEIKYQISQRNKSFTYLSSFLKLG